MLKQLCVAGLVACAATATYAAPIDFVEVADTPGDSLTFDPTVTNVDLTFMAGTTNTISGSLGEADPNLPGFVDLVDAYKITSPTDFVVDFDSVSASFLAIGFFDSTGTIISQFFASSSTGVFSGTAGTYFLDVFSPFELATYKYTITTEPETVDIVPLPAGLPLALTALGAFALVRRRT